MLLHSNPTRVSRPNLGRRLRVVRVVPIQRRQRKTRILFYYGRVDQLEWDPKLYTWSDTTPLMAYTAAFGRILLKSKHVVPAVVPTKWQDILHANYLVKWLNVWDKEPTKKKRCRPTMAHLALSGRCKHLARPSK